MTSSRADRLSNTWQCPHCGCVIDVRTFRLRPEDPAQLLCPNKRCARSFAWKGQNKGKLWPEQRVYCVLR